MNERLRMIGLLLILVVILWSTIISINIKPTELDGMTVNYKGIENEDVQMAFDEVIREYEVLHPYEITLEKRKLKKTTMVAQPIINLSNLVKGERKYRIMIAEYIRDSKELRVSDLPTEVLKGWFAHELGHIVDYEKRSVMGMMSYGIRYYTSDEFKKSVEHEADSIAIEHGFHKEIIATKRYLLENELVSESYKDQLHKYYMPIEGVEMCVKDQNPIQPTLNE